MLAPYCYGKMRQERYVDEHRVLKTRLRRLPQSRWAVLIRDHYESYIDWVTYKANQMRLAINTKPRPYEAGVAVRRRRLAAWSGHLWPLLKLTIVEPTRRPITVA